MSQDVVLPVIDGFSLQIRELSVASWSDDAFDRANVPFLDLTRVKVCFAAAVEDGNGLVASATGFDDFCVWTKMLELI